MPHIFEDAASGRARCRGCSRPIAKGELRFGERIANAYAEGETTLWYHPLCAAYRRPEVVLDALAAGPHPPGFEDLERASRATAAHRRLPRIAGGERAPTGQAKCRACREPIAKGSWRVRLVFYEEGRFSPGGFLHLGCQRTYFEGEDIVPALLHFSPELSEAEREELVRACQGGDP
ncbi:MAG TPA: hypothetical protein VFV75_16755 [Candidatus Polarisedimenticolaceae bacterium]|nr:hypothetical protein [Candidatus Polarisedimenticolaceae bacterium]